MISPAFAALQATHADHAGMRTPGPHFTGKGGFMHATAPAVFLLNVKFSRGRDTSRRNGPIATRPRMKGQQNKNESQGHMPIHSKIAIAAIAFAGLSMASAAYALEEGQVSIAYADGYMGTDSQFHAWEHRIDAQAFRVKHADQYRSWRHDDPRHKDSK
jgi:hypothetical protein